MSTSNALAPPQGLTPQQAAREAALARLASPPQQPPTSDPNSAHRSNTPEQPFNPSAQSKLPFHRLLDSELLPNLNKPQAVKTLDTLLTLITNILEPPNPAQAAKYRQVKMSNKTIVQNIVNIKGAVDYLVAAGFRTTTSEFTQYMTFSSSPSSSQLHTLKIAHLVLKTVLVRAKEAEEREKRFRDAEKEAEKGRKEKVMLGYEEDRRLKKEKDEREKIVREARAAAATAAALQVREELSNPLVTDQRTDASTMDLDGDEEPPPSYGALHGRVLGTGEPVSVSAPRGDRMVSEQDLEEED